MHTFDVYRLYCCLLCLWFLVCLPWIGSRGRNQIKTKCNITLRAFRFASDRVCNIWNVYFSESFRCDGKALVLLLPPPPPGCLLGNGDRATAQNKRRVIFNTASVTNFHSLLFRFVLSFAGLVVGFDLFALLLAFRTEFVFDIVCWCLSGGSLNMSLSCVGT